MDSGLSTKLRLGIWLFGIGVVNYESIRFYDYRRSTFITPIMSGRLLETWYTFANLRTEQYSPVQYSFYSIQISAAKIKNKYNLLAFGPRHTHERSTALSTIQHRQNSPLQISSNMVSYWPSLIPPTHILSSLVCAYNNDNDGQLHKDIDRN